MKFLIKTSAVGVSDKKFAKQGEYETEDKKEIERIRGIAKRFPNDIEEFKGKAEASKKDGKTPADPKDPENKAPKDASEKASGKPTNNSKK